MMKSGPLALLFFYAAAAAAQVLPASTNPVRMGHLHIVSAQTDAQKRFWTEALGAQFAHAGQFDIYKIPGTLVVVAHGSPSAGAADSVVNHVGFKVRDLAGVLAKCEAIGTQVVTRNPRQAMLEIPDGVRVELTADPTLTTPVANHHIHFYTRDTNETRNWYDDLFNAVPGTRGPFSAADLPGVNLTFSQSQDALAGTRGHALDHIGFEVRNLESFTRDLQKSGITLAVPYTKVPSLGIAIAFITDPWGTYIELTEGLDKLQ